jgi:hypothetical protein
MSPGRHIHELLLVAAFAVLAGGCATRPGAAPASDAAAAPPAPYAVLRSAKSDAALEDRILALDPDRITRADISNTLAGAPAPRIVLVHGGVYPVHLAMTSFGRFLTEMGYPEERIRHPGDGRWSHSPYENSAQIAGLVAWYYERDGLRPMMVGHSQGGVQVVRVLYQLAGRFGETIRVWNPYTDAAEPRTAIVDPLTGGARPVLGLSVSYGSAVAAGGSMMLLPNQWDMVDKLRTIPDTVEDFTGFSIALDFVALSLPGIRETTEYGHNGTARVRNVILPAGYHHVTTPFAQALAEDPATREWIDAYVPDAALPDPPPETVGYGVMWAADVWHSVKKHWALEAQRFVRARRALADGLK